MQKIISLFQRNYDGDRLVRDEVVPGAEWVLAGEGVATQKWDGTATLIAGGQFFKRYDAKHGKTPPLAFVPAQPEADPVHGPAIYNARLFNADSTDQARIAGSAIASRGRCSGSPSRMG